jgi:hypothetical protein
MRTPRQAFNERAIIRALLQCGAYPCPETALKYHVELFVGDMLTQSEFDESLRYLDSERRIINGEGETCRVWSITEAGRMWAKEHRV